MRNKRKYFTKISATIIFISLNFKVYASIPAEPTVSSQKTKPLQTPSQYVTPQNQDEIIESNNKIIEYNSDSIGALREHNHEAKLQIIEALYDETVNLVRIFESLGIKKYIIILNNKKINCLEFFNDFIEKFENYELQDYSDSAKLDEYQLKIREILEEIYHEQTVGRGPNSYKMVSFMQKMQQLKTTEMYDKDSKKTETSLKAANRELKSTNRELASETVTEDHDQKSSKINNSPSSLITTLDNLPDENKNKANSYINNPLPENKDEKKSLISRIFHGIYVALEYIKNFFS